jgi:hypothetical protein
MYILWQVNLCCDMKSKFQNIIVLAKKDTGNLNFFNFSEHIFNRTSVVWAAVLPQLVRIIEVL